MFMCVFFQFFRLDKLYYKLFKVYLLVFKFLYYAKVFFNEYLTLFEHSFVDINYLFQPKDTSKMHFIVVVKFYFIL